MLNVTRQDTLFTFHLKKAETLQSRWTKEEVFIGKVKAAFQTML